MSGYVLDGIETAMEPTKFQGTPTIECPCGYWVAMPPLQAKRKLPEIQAALRFHYAWCPKAKVPEKDR